MIFTVDYLLLKEDVNQKKLELSESEDGEDSV